MKGLTNRTAKEPSEDSFVRGFGFSPQTGGKYKVGQLSVCAGMGGKEAAGKLATGVHGWAQQQSG